MFAKNNQSTLLKNTCYFLEEREIPCYGFELLKVTEPIKNSSTFNGKRLWKITVGFMEITY